METQRFNKVTVFWQALTSNCGIICITQIWQVRGSEWSKRSWRRARSPDKGAVNTTILYIAALCSHHHDIWETSTPTCDSLIGQVDVWTFRVGKWHGSEVNSVDGRICHVRNQLKFLTSDSIISERKPWVSRDIMTTLEYDNHRDLESSRRISE